VKTEYFITGLVIAGFLYLGGYVIAAKWVALFCFFFWLVGLLKPKPKKSKSSNILEPIIIESTRGAPYRIPSEMTLKFKPEADQKKKEWEQATGKGLIGELGKAIGRGIRKLVE